MQTELFKVTGMTCGGCASNVKQALQEINGVGDVKVSLMAGKAIAQYDERLTTPDQLKVAATGAGYGVDEANTAQKPQARGCCCG